jgi:mannose-1-phosphate guanylyltransferase
MIAFHNRRPPEVVGTLALTEGLDSARFGEVIMADDGRIVTFNEKVTGRGGHGLINAGAYVLEPRVLELIPGGRASSLEREIFPALAAAGQLGGTIVTGSFVDIGTPAGYAELAALLTS